MKNEAEPDRKGGEQNENAEDDLVVGLKNAGKA